MNHYIENLQGKLFWIVLFLILPSIAFASSDNFFYEISAKTIDLSQAFTRQIYIGIATQYRGIYLLLCIISFSILIYCYLQSNASMDTLFVFLTTIYISSAIALNYDTFHSIIYEPFFTMLYNMCAFVVTVASGHHSKPVDSVQDMFKLISDSMMKFHAVMGKIKENASFSILSPSSWIKNIAYVLEIFMVRFLILFLSAYFTVKFTISIVLINMLMTMMPITLSLFPFKNYRSYAYNNFKNILFYGLVAIFSAMAMALTIFLLDNIMKQDINELSFETFMSFITVGLLGYLLIHSSGELSAKLINTTNSNMFSSSAVTKVAGALTAISTLGGGLGTAFLARKPIGNAIKDVMQSNRQRPTGAMSDVVRMSHNFKSPPAPTPTNSTPAK